MTKDSSSEQFEINIVPEEDGGFFRLCTTWVIFLLLSGSQCRITMEMLLPSLLILLPTRVTLKPLVKEALTVTASSEYRVPGAGQGIQGKWQKSRTTRLIGADNIEDVAELNQQAIDHVKIISEFRF